MSNIITASTPIHPFQKAGLGQAPFRFRGLVDQQMQQIAAAEKRGGMPQDHKVGGSCDLCGTYIVNMYWFSDASNKRFKVGGTCCDKVEAEWAAMNNGGYDARELENARRNARLVVQRKRRATANESKLEAIRVLLRNADNRATLDALPHPKGFDGSLMNWIEWTWDNAGMKGKTGLLKIIKDALD